MHRPRTGCSSRDERNKFFSRKAPAAPADDPRTPFSGPARRHFPNTGSADDSVPDTGGSVRDGRPSPAHWPDTSPALGLATSGAPLPDTQGCSSTVARRTEETNDPSLRTSTAATEVGRGDIEIPVEIKQTDGGPREVLLPKVKPRFEAQHFDPRRLFSHRSVTAAHFTSTLIPPSEHATTPTRHTIPLWLAYLTINPWPFGAANEDKPAEN